MPEGDTIYGAAQRIRHALVGKEIASIETPHPRHARDRWPERLGGRGVRAVESRGKHLFIRFDGEPVVGSEAGALLVELGFRQGPRRLTLSA